MTKLFDPLEIGPVEVPNRIAVAPMCQYSAHDGCADVDWHGQHLMNLAMSGAGLVVIEATAVERPGRITHGCLGLWDDATEAGVARMLAAARRFAHPGTKFGIQLAHAGRKASAQRTWEGGRALAADADPWTTVSASAVPFDAHWHTPVALDQAGIDRISSAFVAASLRAVRLGIDVIELHAAHGYLLHQFTSPLSNRRTDRYGGSLENRLRLPLEIIEAVRAAVPAYVAVGARITGTDWRPDGITIEEAVAFARELKALRADYVCVTSGGIVPGISIPVAEGYQVPLAEQIRRDSGIMTRAVGLIVDPVHADLVVSSGRADQVALARAFIDNPRWVWHAAQRLGAAISCPPPYDRIRPGSWPGAALARPK
jgi:2,4-dienoyl-CoA reductase-like NADH-dependent reductase (Old Yellow Enzyme family)